MADERQQSSEREEQPGDGASRRGFFRNVMWASAGLFAVQAAISGLAMFWPRKVEGFGATMDIGPVDNYPVGSVTRIREGKFYLSRLSEDRLIALYWVCPHLGCTVP